jgi:hypothetical protein
MLTRLKMSIRPAASWVLCSLQAIFAVLHFFPSLAYRVPTPASPTPAPTMSIVAYIDSLGPFWVYGFGVSAAVLALSLRWKKSSRTYTHIFCGGVFASYMIALFFGALFDHPHGPLTLPILACLPVAGHAFLAISYGGDREHQHQ